MRESEKKQLKNEIHFAQQAVSHKRGCMPAEIFVQICKCTARLSLSEPPPAPICRDVVCNAQATQLSENAKIKLRELK